MKKSFLRKPYIITLGVIALLLIVVPLALSSAQEVKRKAIRTKPTSKSKPKALKRAPLKKKIARPVLIPTSESYYNLSKLHYGWTRRAIPIYEGAEPADDLKAKVKITGKAQGQTKAASLKQSRRLTKTLKLTKKPSRPTWNSPQGRKAAGDRFAIGTKQADVAATKLDRAFTGPVTAKNAEWKGGFVCTEPDIVIADSSCCNYWYKDQVAGSNVVYRQPYTAFKDPDPDVAEQNARDFADTVNASMPIFLPYKSGKVGTWQGWIYNNGNFHGAMDYGKSSISDGEDPAFKVYSVASGKVVTVLWDNWSGNVVIIEHTAPNGKKYRSGYKHLRDGYNHDLAKAKAIPVPEDKKFDKDGKPTRLYKYNKFANKPSPSTLLWGTNSQKIAVKPGDKVRVGQLIGWSGNTGPGGAGWGLDDDGNPKNPKSGNNHLHFMMTVQNPPPGSKEWVQVDPYGVYNQMSTKCYDVLDDTAYARLFAPFYPSFHNVPTPIISKYFNYYTGMGMGLQTLSLHRKGGKVLSSGSFQWGLPHAWYARFYMTSSNYQSWFNHYGDKGFRPRQISVTHDGKGKPRFSVIWKKRGGESYYAYHNMTDSLWKKKWDKHVVKGKMRVEDRVSYSVNGKRRQAAVFVGDGNKAFYELHYMYPGTFQAKFDEITSKGFSLVSVDAAKLGGKTLFGGIWRKRPGSWIARHGLTPSAYQQAFNKYGAQGFRLHRVHGYADSGRFAAIWKKP